MNDNEVYVYCTLIIKDDSLSPDERRQSLERLLKHYPIRAQYQASISQLARKQGVQL